MLKKIRLHSSILCLITILMIYPLPQIAIDLYLPSWPEMMRHFNATHAEMQLSLLIYLFCLGMAQLIYGILSRHYGRKFLLLIGCSIFLVSSILCAMATTIEQLIILRGIQGLGIGCGFTIASTLLSDMFTGKKLATMSSYSTMIYSLSVIFAPVVGGTIQQYYGWRANFLVMVIYCIGLIFSVTVFVTETKKTTETPVVPYPNLSSSYFKMFSNIQFNLNVLSLIIAYGIMVAFNTVAPFIFQEQLHLSAMDYGKYLFFIGLAYCLGSLLNSYLLKSVSLEVAIKFGFILMLISSFGLFISIHENAISAYSIAAWTSLAFMSVGFIYPNCFAKALDLFSEKGLASAFIGCAILIGVSVSTLLSSHYSNSPELYLGFILLISGLLGSALNNFNFAQLINFN